MWLTWVFYAGLDCSIFLCVCSCLCLFVSQHAFKSSSCQVWNLPASASEKNKAKQKPALFIVLSSLIFPAAPVGSSTTRRSCLFPLAFTTDWMRALSKTKEWNRGKKKILHFWYPDWRNVLSDSLQEWQWEKLAWILLAHFLIPFFSKPRRRLFCDIVFCLMNFVRWVHACACAEMQMLAHVCLI